MNSKVLLTVPTRGQIQWATVTRLEEIRDSMPGMPPIIYQPGNLSVAQTRNKIVHRFMQTDCEVLVMVDDDVVPSPHWLGTILSSMNEYAMIGLPHPMPHPSDPSQLRLSVLDWDQDGLKFKTDLKDGLNECDALATGCVAIARGVIEVLGDTPFRITNDPYAEITSDDFLFCQDLRKHDYKIGYYWDGWYADHITSVSLAPLFEVRLPV